MDPSSGHWYLTLPWQQPHALGAIQGSAFPPGLMGARGGREKNCWGKLLLTDGEWNAIGEKLRQAGSPMVWETKGSHALQQPHVSSVCSSQAGLLFPAHGCRHYLVRVWFAFPGFQSSKDLDQSCGLRQDLDVHNHWCPGTSSRLWY